MGTGANWAYGTTLKRAGNVIAELASIDVPKLKTTMIDVSTHDSADGYNDFMGGFHDGGEISVKGNFKPGDTSGQIGLRDDHDANTVQAFILTFPVAMAAVWTFNGLVSGLETGPADSKGAVAFSATIKVTGKPVLSVTLSAGASAMAGIEENTGAALVPVPAFAVGTFINQCTVNTASTWVKLTTTAAGVITITTPDLNALSQTVASTVQSGPIPIGAAASVTKVNVNVKETNKVAKNYVIYITRP